MSHLYRRPKKNGTYWLAFYKDGKLHRESQHTKDLSAARYLQNKKDRELIEGKNTAPNQGNLCQPILEGYLSHYEHRRTKTANDKSKHEVEDFLTWGNIKTFEQITEKKFQEYLNHKINDKHIKQLTLNRYIASIKAWLSYCIKLRYIFFNPLSNVKKFRVLYNPKRFFSVDEIKAVLKASQKKELYIDKKPTLYPAIATGIYGGPRPEELFTLEWPNFDFKRNQITIKNKEGFTIKTRKFRVIPLHDKLKKILIPLRKESGLCFDTTNRRRIFKRILKEANADMITAGLLPEGSTALIKDVNWYTLRHTFGSHAAMAGVPLPTLAAWMGHSSITTTMIYAHLSPGHHKTEIDKVKF